MTIDQIPTTGITGITTPPRDDVDKKNEQFAQYLMAIKGARLTETQLQRLSETTANDERTRTVEKINERKADSDDEQYRKMRGNGYTVGEMRRGQDQVDKALERQTLATQSAESREQSAECRVQSADTKETEIQRGSMQQSASELPNVPGAMSNDATITVVGQNTLDTNGAVSQAQDMANASTQQAGNTTANDAGNSTTNTPRSIVEQIAIKASEQQVSYHTTTAGKTATSLAASMMVGMAPVSRLENARLTGELDAKITNATGLTNTPKETAKDNLTQQALTAASETQHVANDPGQSQPDPGAAQASRDVAESQMLPNTSLMERLDQARLVNRVAGAFRSLANQSGTIRMKLHPEELGALTLRMQIESGRVTAKLEAETETAKQVLLENIETLKKRLKEQNLEVTAFDIEVVPSEEGKDNKTLHTQQSRHMKPQNNHIDYYS